MLPTPRPSLLTGIHLTCVAVVLFGLLDSSSRFIAATIPVLVALWVRYVTQVVMTVALLRRKTGQWLPASQNLPWQIVRACAYILSSAFAFISLRYIKVAEFTAIAMISPVVVSVLAIVVLREKLPLIRWLLLAAALTGALLIIRPGGMNFQWVLLLPLVQVAGNVFYLLVTAHLARYDEPLVSHLYTGLIGLAIVSAILPFVWTDFSADWTLWAALLGGALAASTGHLLLAQAYRHAPATILMPYLYVQVAVAVLLGWLFFGNVPDRLSSIGIVTIVASGVAGALLSWLRPIKPATTA